MTTSFVHCGTILTLWGYRDRGSGRTSIRPYSENDRNLTVDRDSGGDKSVDLHEAGKPWRSGSEPDSALLASDFHDHPLDGGWEWRLRQLAGLTSRAGLSLAAGEEDDDFSDACGVVHAVQRTVLIEGDDLASAAGKRVDARCRCAHGDDHAVAGDVVDDDLNGDWIGPGNFVGYLDVDLSAVGEEYRPGYAVEKYLHAADCREQEPVKTKPG